MLARSLANSSVGLYTSRAAGLWSQAVESSAAWTWAVEISYACACGVYFAAQRWRWIDAERSPELARRAHEMGPLTGSCPSCGREAVGLVEWLEVRPSKSQASLVMGPQQRGEVLRALREHVAALEARPAATQPWLLQPTLSFASGRMVSDSGMMMLDADAIEEVGRQASEDTEVTIVEMTIEEEEAEEEEEALEETPLPSPAPVGPIQREAIGEVDLIDDRVVVRVHLDEATAKLWATAALSVRPVLLRTFVYPLLGVRVVTGGPDPAVIDGLIDVGDLEAHEVFSRLAAEFALDLVVYGARGATALRRQLAAPGRERNAALCLESARGLLASGEFKADAFLKAQAALAAGSAAARLQPAPVILRAGEFDGIADAAAAWSALERLELASTRENLSHLLEVDGLELDAYEAMRKRALAAAVEYGLCPPSRFWRRIFEGGEGAAAVIGKMVAARAQRRGGALSAENELENWFRLRELCDKKKVPHPADLQEALANESARPMGRRRSHQPPMSASGEIGEAPAPAPARAPAIEALHQPKTRLSRASELLGSNPTFEQIKAVLHAMEDFDDAEILALLPTLAELGARAALPLSEVLRSSRREVRQSAAILLGLARDSRAIEALCDGLISEATNGWRDLARALGNYGPRVVGPLCDVIRRSDAARKERAIPRVARALAEVVLSDGKSRGGPGRNAVEALVEVQDPSIASAAQRALATLSDVNSAGEEVRGERPLAEETAVRGFARRAYEAITTPELEVVEADFEELG
jgi:hypothetical protein